jgi:polysaccharide biosynthesis protein PslH
MDTSVKALRKISELHFISQVSAGALGRRGEEHFRSVADHFLYAPVSPPHDTSLNAPFLIDYVRQHSIDVVWLGFGNVSYPLLHEIKRRAPEIKVVCDTDAVWSRFVLRELPFCKDLSQQREIEQRGRAKMVEEEEGLRIADVTTAVSNYDASYYLQTAPAPERVMLFSNVIDFDAYRNIPARHPSLPPRYLYLAGTFYASNAPMVQAAQWFIGSVWPRIRKELPDVGLVVLGNGADKELGSVSADGLQVVGYVDSVLPYLCHADASVVPLWFESGTRFKILEAGACRVPIVSTTLGAEGLPALHNQHLLLADSPEDFARACIEMIQNRAKAKSLADRCYELVKQQYTTDRLADDGRNVLRFLGILKDTQILSIPDCDLWELKNRSGEERAVREAMNLLAMGRDTPSIIQFLSQHDHALFRELATRSGEEQHLLVERLQVGISRAMSSR